VLFRSELRQFRRSLWGWLGSGAVLLLMLQGMILRWGLRPLRRVAADLVEIESGRAARLSGQYPPELEGLTGNLNALIDASQSHLARYRDALGDLAHSLKTPLAVLRATLEQAALPDTEKRSAQDEIERMNRIVSYQLQRAAAAGRVNLTNPVNVLEKARQIRASLDKVYAGKAVECWLDVADDVGFQGDEGDLFEILGNLMENAYKWCRGQVRLTAVSINDHPLQSLELRIEDNGPGIAEDKAKEVLQRGERAGAEAPGHGLGLAIVESIVQTYSGQISIHHSLLGGAEIRVRL
jgi:two-component system sensor histidine kinase PhoQ